MSEMVSEKEMCHNDEYNSFCLLCGSQQREWGK